MWIFLHFSYYFLFLSSHIKEQIMCNDYKFCWPLIMHLYSHWYVQTVFF